MTSFDRRRLFSLGLASAGLSAAPSWLTRWFTPDEALPGSGTEDPKQDPKQDPLEAVAAIRVKQLTKAIGRAQAEGKPLLMFVVPENSNGWWERGRWLGAFLNHASDVTKMELALSVVACGKASELKKLTEARFDGKPTMVLVDVREGRRGGPAPKTTTIEATLGRIGVGPVADEKHQDRIKREAEHIKARLKILSEELTRGMHRHGSNLKTLAAVAQRHLGSEDAQALTDWFAGGARPNDPLLVRSAAEVRRVAAGRGGAARAAMLTELVAAFDRHVVKQPVAGARWMIPGGCGAEPERKTEREKEDLPRIACGMAHTPALCERFLGFYSMV